MENKTEQFKFGYELTKELIKLWNNYGDNKKINDIIQQLYNHYIQDDDVYEGFVYYMGVYGGQNSYHIKKTLKDIWNSKK